MSAAKRKKQTAASVADRRSLPEHISLDQRLLHEARRLINGANVHRLMGLVFAYELSVSVHNEGLLIRRCISYDSSAEVELRRLILRYRIDELNCQLGAAAQKLDEIRVISNRRIAGKL